CGETCLLGTCYTTGCTCNKYRVCTKDGSVLN
nr:Chain A, kalata B8 [Oldenlandia affinis]